MEKLAVNGRAGSGWKSWQRMEELAEDGRAGSEWKSWLGRGQWPDDNLGYPRLQTGTSSISAHPLEIQCCRYREYRHRGLWRQTDR